MGLGFSLLGARGSRHLYDEASPTVFAVVTADLATVLLHDSVAHAKAKPCPLPDRTRRIERIKHAVRLADSGTIVGKLDTHVSIERAAGNLDGSPALFC